ncbi:unnamed protein product [Meloidogyne enterolobii]|uniref:Uncharacterized protein n=1 Tax=Meloidogyne enterolobii TaxID=390850 RepID=A0ACB0ZBD9_MELEN
MSSDAKKLKLDDDASGGGSVSSIDRESSLSDENKIKVVEGENADESVYVKDKATGRERWIELSSDGTLDFFSVEHGFPGCWGLEYSSSIGVCIVRFNDNNKTFLPPNGGWKGKEFNVIYRVDSSPCRIESPFKVNNVVQNPAPKLKALSPYLFYMLRNDRKLCVTAVTKYFFVTYRHGSNLKHQLETTIKIYRHDNDSDSEQFFTATVKLISQKHDFILLKSDKLINDFEPYHCDPPFKGRHICMYGYGNKFNKLTHGGGYIHSDELQRFKNTETGEIRGPFLLMHVGSDYGDSGASVWCSAGLIGLNLGRIGFKTPPGSVVTTDLVKEAATFPKRNYVVTIERIMDSVKEVEAKENPAGLDIDEPIVINIPGEGDFSEV